MNRVATKPGKRTRGDEKPATKAKKAEETKMIVSGIAHAFNNLFTVILGSSELLQYKIPPGATCQNNLREIHKAVFRGTDIIRQLVYYAGLSSGCRHGFHLGKIVRDAVGTALQAPDVPTVEIRFYCDEESDFVFGNSEEVRKMLVGICANAIEAMEGKEGKLLVELSNDKLPETGGNHDWKRYVVITITDNGRGMNRETQKRAFDPFFTTRPGVRGGMGLAVARAVVARHSGTISVRSRIGEGSSFVIALPASDMCVSFHDKRTEGENYIGHGSRYATVAARHDAEAS